jgi:hypothetical protein
VTVRAQNREIGGRDVSPVAVDMFDFLGDFATMSIKFIPAAAPAIFS